MDEIKESMKDHKKATKSYEVIKISKKPYSQFGSVEVDGKKYDLGRRTNAMRIRDKKLAMAMKQALPDDILVYEVDDVATKDQKGHNYFHVVPPLPWHEKDEK